MFLIERLVGFSFVTFQAKTRTQNILPGKTPGFPREFTGTHRDLPGSLPGFTGKFTGIHQEVHRDVPESFLGYGFCLLWIHWEIPGSAGVLTEKARDLPGYCNEFPSISPVNDR